MRKRKTFSLTRTTERGMFAAEGPCPEEFLFEARGFVGDILQKSILLWPCGQVVEFHSTFRSLSKRCLLQREEVDNFDGGWLGSLLDMIQGFQHTEDPIPVCL